MILRRQFLASVAAALPASVGITRGAGNSAKFKLHYGPHPGMFRHSAGEDIIDQIHFAADQGFTAWEDNGAMGRPVELQTKIGEALAKRSMTMGVFVAYADFKTSDGVAKTDKAFQDTVYYIRDLITQLETGGKPT